MQSDVQTALDLNLCEKSAVWRRSKFDELQVPWYKRLVNSESGFKWTLCFQYIKVGYSA